MFFRRKKIIMAAILAVATVFMSIAQKGESSPGQGTVIEALFNLDSPASCPFPSDLFTVPDHTNKTHRRVSLPLPDCQIYVSNCEDIAVLNELDGFNVQPRLSVPFSGPIDVNTVTSNTLFLVSLGSTGPGQNYMPWGTPVGIDQVVWDTFTNTLHVESDALLAQHTRFALIVTRGILNEGGAPVEASDAFLRFRANVREEYKQSLLEAIQAARYVGVREKDIAVVSVFTTRSVTTILEKIRDQIHAAAPDPADFHLGPGGERTVFNLDDVSTITSNQQTTVDPPAFTPAAIDLTPIRTTFPGAVGTLAFGRYPSPDYQVHPGEYIPQVGTGTGWPAVQEINDIYFNLFLPSGPEPVGGWPVVIFGHGNAGNKNVTPLNFVSSMAKYGIATIAINMAGYGYGPLSTLTIERTDGGQITFTAGGRGIDQNDDNIIGSPEGLYAAPPRSVVFASDGFRQTAADVMQLVQVINAGVDVNDDGQPDLDFTRIYFLGNSYGGSMGIGFVAVEPQVQAAALAVSPDPVPMLVSAFAARPLVGGALALRQPSLLNSPGIKLLAGRTVRVPRYDDNLPLRNQKSFEVQLTNNSYRIIQSPVINTVAGAMAIQQLLENYEWISQAGSPVAYAPYLQKAPLEGLTAKPVLLLIAKGDETAPNPTTTAILRAGDLADTTLYYRHDLYRIANPSLPTNPHGFLQDFDTPAQSAIALAVQDQVGQFFFSNGGFIPIPEPSQFLEFPIPLPLPEDLNYIIP